MQEYTCLEKLVSMQEYSRLLSTAGDCAGIQLSRKAGSCLEKLAAVQEYSCRETVPMSLFLAYSAPNTSMHMYVQSERYCYAHYLLSTPSGNWSRNMSLFCIVSSIYICIKYVNILYRLLVHTYSMYVLRMYNCYYLIQLGPL